MSSPLRSLGETAVLNLERTRPKQKRQGRLVLAGLVAGVLNMTLLASLVVGRHDVRSYIATDTRTLMLVSLERTSENHSLQQGMENTPEKPQIVFKSNTFQSPKIDYHSSPLANEPRYSSALKPSQDYLPQPTVVLPPEGGKSDDTSLPKTSAAAAIRGLLACSTTGARRTHEEKCNIGAGGGVAGQYLRALGRETGLDGDGKRADDIAAAHQALQRELQPAGGSVFRFGCTTIAGVRKCATY